MPEQGSMVAHGSQQLGTGEYTIWGELMYVGMGWASWAGLLNGQSEPRRHHSEGGEIVQPRENDDTKTRHANKTIFFIGILSSSGGDIDRFLRKPQEFRGA